MNFYALNIQRKLIFISAVAGVISVFLPWFSAGTLGSAVHINGFHRWGIAAFFCFTTAVVIGLTGKQTEILDKHFGFAAVITGTLSLVSVVITIMSSGGGMFGPVETETEFGIWLALTASIGIIGFALKFKKSEHDVKAGFESQKKSVIVSPVTRKANILIEIDKISELERLNKLKENGSLTEEEF